MLLLPTFCCLTSCVIQKNLMNRFGIIHLVHSQNFPTNKHFVTPDTHTYVGVSGGTKCLLVGKFCEYNKWTTPLEKILKYSTVNLDCDLEKISWKLKFGIDVPYTFRIHQKKSPPIAPWEQSKSIMADLQLFFFILIWIIVKI